MPSTKRTTAITDRRRRVAEAYLRGVPQTQIAQAEGVHHGQISRDLAAVRKAWQADAAMAFGDHVARQLAKLDELERTYWTAWQQSKHDSKGAPEKTGGIDLDGTPIAAGQRVEGNEPGDPRFLAGVESCIDKRCKILGLYSQKIEHTGNISHNVLVIEVETDGSDAGNPVFSIPSYPSAGRGGEVVPVSCN
jgi:hypothetical protein